MNRMEAGTDTGRQPDHLRKNGNKNADFRDGKLARQEQPRLYLITWNDNADTMLNLPGGGAMLFLTDVDHVSFEKANGTRQNNLQSATVSLQVVIGLCKRKETAALKIKAAVSNGRVKLSALRRLFFFCRRPAEYYSIFNSMFPVKFSHSMPI